jgi:Ni/Co efflux regulator RcnB
MMKIACAAALAMVLSAPAAAAIAPGSRDTTAAATAEPLLMQIQDRRFDDRRSFDRRRGVHRHQYVPGRRYGRPPASWRQYRARPRDWRTRGCIIVGPVWWCP